MGRYCVRIALLTLALYLSLPSAAAYIDPGTGGLIVNSWGAYVIGVVGAVGAFIALRFIKPLKIRIKNIIRGKKDGKP